MEFLNVAFQNSVLKSRLWLVDSLTV